MPRAEYRFFRWRCRSGSLRILHIVTNSDLGGAPRVVTELSSRAVRDGHECAVAASPNGPMWDRLDARVKQRPIVAMRRKIDPFHDSLALIALLKLYRSFAPDIIHLHSSKAGALGRLAAMIAGASLSRRCLYTVHGFDTILASHREFLPLERLLSAHCGAIVPVSSYDERQMIRARLNGKITLIRNGVTDRRGLPGVNPAIEQRILEAKASGKPVVLSVARLEAPKRPDLFIAVARLIPEASFFWVGNVSAPGQEYFAGAKQPANVAFLGECPEAGNLINACDVFLLLSDYEGLPMSILEALSCGKAVVASNVGGIPEALGRSGDEVAGFAVPNAPEAIAAQLERLSRDAGLRRRLGTRARSLYEAEFSAERMWAAYLNLYSSMVLT